MYLKTSAPQRFCMDETSCCMILLPSHVFQYFDGAGINSAFMSDRKHMACNQETSCYEN